MKKPIVSVLLMLIALVFQHANAQQTILRVDTVMFPYSGAFCCSQPYNFDVKVSNQGTVQYNGSFELLYLTDKMIANNDSPAAFFPTQQLILNPANILQFSLDSFSFDTISNFKIGGNIVVVWPRSVTGTAFLADTFRTEIFVWPYHAGIAETASNMIITTYPNPVSNYLTIQAPDLGYTFEEVRIWDLLGNCVIKNPYSHLPVNVSALKNGIYMLQIKTKNGEAFWKKFIVNR